MMRMHLDPVERELSQQGHGSVIALVNAVIDTAHARRASDIHFSPTRDELVTRFRIDGVLIDAYTIPQTTRSEVIARIKVLAGLRTDEHQMTQDGRFRHTGADGVCVDIRVSIAPTYHGENAVLRILSDTATPYTLETLGFNARDREKIVDAIRKPNGMILATGPTGSGKTTTLYTLIRMLNTRDVSIITIEDPIEYAIDGVEQMQVNQRAGLTFANGLRTILRQDPNIIMVGEIRDAETAHISVHTALTGHILLSTLHTNDAATTLPRLLDMQTEAFLVASTIRLAIGQRLVRKICHHCKVPRPLTEQAAAYLATLPLRHPVTAHDTFYTGKGCEACGHRGYAGRICLNEVLVSSPAIQEAILHRAPSRTLKRIAREEGMTSMLDDGFTKARNGITTVEEVLRVVNE